jgi:hypothetical protein
MLVLGLVLVIWRVLIAGDHARARTRARDMARPEYW